MEHRLIFYFTRIKLTMEKYIKLGHLGTGSHGTVYLVKNLNNNQVFK